MRCDSSEVTVKGIFKEMEKNLDLFDFKLQTYFLGFAKKNIWKIFCFALHYAPETFKS